MKNGDDTARVNRICQNKNDRKNREMSLLEIHEFLHENHLFV